MVQRWKSGFVSRLERGERAREVDICGEYEDGSGPENGSPPLVVLGCGAAGDGGAMIHEVEDADRESEWMRTRERAASRRAVYTDEIVGTTSCC